MKKLVLLGLIVGFGLNGFSAECKLFMKPSDFQLDKTLIAPNESKFFSNFGNYMMQGYISGQAGGKFCNGINGTNDKEKVRECLNELQQLTDQDTAELNKQAISVTKTQVEAYGLQTKLYGIKTSANASVSEKHLCYLQNKYGDKIITKSDISLKNINMMVTQEKIAKKYLAVAEQVGSSEDMNTIGRAFVSEMSK